MVVLQVQAPWWLIEQCCKQGDGYIAILGTAVVLLALQVASARIDWTDLAEWILIVPSGSIVLAMAVSHHPRALKNSGRTFGFV